MLLPHEKPIFSLYDGSCYLNFVFILRFSIFYLYIAIYFLSNFHTIILWFYQ